jgi:hypothetical protein
MYVVKELPRTPAENTLANSYLKASMKTEGK